MTIDSDVLSELRALRTEMVARFDGLYVAIDGLRQDTRMARTAINDFARTNVTTGEIEALHQDVNRVQSELMDFRARLMIVEQTIQEKE